MTTRSFRLTMIVACSKKGVIGQAGAIPWQLPADLKRFRKLTWGKPLVMGRRTFESIGHPLPGRLNIVITRQADYQPEGVVIANSPEQALEIAKSEAAQEAMVIGGAEIYSRFLPGSSTIHLTVVEGYFSGDTFFPIEQIGSPDWVLQMEEHQPADMRNQVASTYQVWQRAETIP